MIKWYQTFHQLNIRFTASIVPLFSTTAFLNFFTYDDNTCEFTRTYRLLLITPTENEDDFYVTLQNTEGVQTVLVNNEEKLELEEGQIYEFVFRQGNSIIEDTIQSIFDNTDLVEIKKTDRTLEDGINEPICS